MSFFGSTPSGARMAIYRPSTRALTCAMMLVLALTMRALVPQGWMPDGGGENVFAIKPCPTQWTLPEAPVQMSGHHAHEGMGDMERQGGHSEHRAADPCAFAGFAMPALSGGDFAIVPTAALAPPFFDRARNDAILLARRRTLPPARAPPIPA